MAINGLRHGSSAYVSSELHQLVNTFHAVIHVFLRKVIHYLRHM